VGRDRFTGGGGKDTFVISRGGSIDSIADFGGVGRGGNPSAAILANVDTLRFSGTGLTAKKMLLTQIGANTEISFVGVNNTKVILQNLTLESLDNHRKSNGAGADVSNILFNGEPSAPATDAFDVWDANLNNAQVFRKNTVTFLNSLSNTVSGFEGSDDVINGQLGNDSLQGKSGKDILRGGVGNDTLLGGADDDIVVGNSGNDLINGGKGNDILNGGIGMDSFVFNSNTAFSSADLGIDLLEEFSPATNYHDGDRLILDKTTFTQLTFSAELGFGLKAQEFAIVSSDSAAASSSAFITYNSVNGKLFYNQNGSSSGFGSGAQFATLSGSPVLSVQSFALQA
jgi:Ca2+-binding RTX toxin-like protein